MVLKQRIKRNSHYHNTERPSVLLGSPSRTARAGPQNKKWDSEAGSAGAKRTIVKLAADMGFSPRPPLLGGLIQLVTSAGYLVGGLDSVIHLIIGYLKVENTKKLNILKVDFFLFVFKILNTRVFNCVLKK